MITHWKNHWNNVPNNRTFYSLRMLKNLNEKELKENTSTIFIKLNGKNRRPEIFEEYTYYLLRLVGINKIYRYENQRGSTDGFFVFKNLIVIYDTTLESI